MFDQPVEKNNIEIKDIIYTNFYRITETWHLNFFAQRI